MMMRRLLFLFCVSIIFSFHQLSAQQLVVNEVINMQATGEDIVELLVNCPSGCGYMDIGGYIYDDNGGQTNCVTGQGIAFGHLRFPHNDITSCVPCGTFIMLGTSAGLDTDASDFILSFPYSYMLANPNLPAPPDCTYGTEAQATDAGAESLVELRNAGDMAQVLDTSGNVVSAISWGDASGGTFMGAGSASGLTFYATDCSGGGYQTAQIDQTALETPGAPNPGQESCINAQRTTIIHDNETIVSCTEMSYTFTHDACGVYSSTDWDFGDGNTSIGEADNITTHTFSKTTGSPQTFYITASVNYPPSCPIEVKDTLIINFPDAPPVPDSPESALVCLSASNTFNICQDPGAYIPAVGGDIVWYAAATGGSPLPFSGENPNILSWLNGQSASIISQLNSGIVPYVLPLYAAYDDGTCESARLAVNVNIYPTIVLNTPEPVCLSDNTVNVILSNLVTTPNNNSLIGFSGNPNIYQNAAGDYLLDVNPSAGDTHPGGTGVGTFTLNYTYEGFSGTCSACGGTVTIEVIDQSSIVINAPTEVCEDAGNITLTATPAGGAWYGTGVVNPTEPGGGNLTGIYNPNLFSNGVGTIRYYSVNNTNSQCFTEVNITAVDAPTLGSPPDVCNTVNNFFMSSYVQPVGTVGTWSQTSGASAINLSNPDAVSFVGATAGNYVFTFTPSGVCSTKPVSMTLTVNDCACPIVDILEPFNDICADGTLALATTISTTTSGTWSIVSPTGTAASIIGSTFNANGATGTFIVRYTILGAVPAGCETQFEIQVAVAASQTAGTDGILNACNNSTTDIILADNITGESVGGTWTASPTPASGFSAAAGTFNPNNVSAGNYTFTYTISGSCVTDATSQVQVAINEAPQVNVTTPTATVCNGGGTTGLNLNTLLGTPVPAGTWADTDNSGAANAGALFDFFGVTPGNYTFTFTTTSAVAPCTNVSATVEITVEDCSCPVINASNATAQVCENGSISFSATISTLTNFHHLDLTDGAGNTITLTQSGTNFTGTAPAPNVIGCDGISFNYTFDLYCNTAPTVIYNADVVSVMVYPQPTATLNLSSNGCTVTATPDCPNFSIVGANSQTTSTNGDNSAVSFTVQNDDFSSCTNTINGNFNCVIVQNCPTVSVPAAATEDFVPPPTALISIP
ncbi:MAG: hypothetical protein IPL35_14510 [Sphingobacteriales bacterium]|nr:hypothetical protein [Sphingobacteriales bacterium]